MKAFYKTLSIIIILSFVLNFTACGVNKETSEEVNNLPRYSQVTALENKGENSEVYKIENKDLYKIGAIESLLGLTYNSKNQIYVYTENISKGQNFNHNKITIIKDNRKKELKDFYTALDTKLSPTGDKLAFRSFKEDSMESAEGMKIYDIKKSKYISLKSKVLVSGNLYGWISDNKIIYYGSMEGKSDSDKIYSYDFDSNKEEVYLDNTNGYCLHFIPIGNNILFISSQGNSQSIYYFDSEKNTTKSIATNMTSIIRSAANYQTGEAFFIGSEGDEKQMAVYKFSSKDLKIQRLTYDFPKELDEDSEIAMDIQGNIYFCGMDEPDQENSLDVYMYNREEGSINLISTHKGKYNVYSSG
ncbi:MAG: hypothetical protein F8N39_03280 [Clostridiaceae bacterium]|nr:hypothetical protein [Clostridiaceae bacterium]